MVTLVVFTPIYKGVRIGSKVERCRAWRCTLYVNRQVWTNNPINSFESGTENFQPSAGFTMVVHVATSRADDIRAAPLLLTN